jgi:hypothetical protein
MVYIATSNPRRVNRALFGLFEGAVGMDMVSRARRKVKVDRDTWCARDLADEDVVRIILADTVIKTWIDKKAANILVLATIRLHRDNREVLLLISNVA